MNRAWVQLIPCLLLILLNSRLGFSAEFNIPTKKGSVQDSANLFSEKVLTVLNTISARLYKNHFSLLILTIPSLPKNVSIEKYSSAVYDNWNGVINDTSQGVLIVVAKRDRSTRIETSTGTQPYLPDSACKTILESVVIPEFKKGKFDSGILGATTGIISRFNFFLTTTGAKAGNASLQTELGLAYYNWGGSTYKVPKNYTEALKWFQEAANQGNDTAHLFLGFMYHQGEGCKKNLKEALNQFRYSSDKGNAMAQFSLGIIYMLGVDFPVDTQEAIMWIKLAANNNHAPAQDLVGAMYEKGEGGVSQNYKEAFNWYTKSANQGNDMGCLSLGKMYYNGKGVAVDLLQATFWFRKSAEKGNDIAQYYLGRGYAEGEGVQQDNQEALKWFLLSASQGNADAQFNLGLIYGKGTGVTQDFIESKKWFQLSADQGSCESQHNLGIMYLHGQGVEQDYFQGIKWLSLAIDNLLPGKIRDQAIKIRDEASVAQMSNQLSSQKQLNLMTSLSIKASQILAWRNSQEELPDDFRDGFKQGWNLNMEGWGNLSLQTQSDYRSNMFDLSTTNTSEENCQRIFSYYNKKTFEWLAGFYWGANKAEIKKNGHRK